MGAKVTRGPAKTPVLPIFTIIILILLSGTIIYLAKEWHRSISIYQSSSEGALAAEEISLEDGAENESERRDSKNNSEQGKAEIRGEGAIGQVQEETGDPAEDAAGTHGGEEEDKPVKYSIWQDLYAFVLAIILIGGAYILLKLLAARPAKRKTLRRSH